jgi:hypothetical protein
MHNGRSREGKITHGTKVRDKKVVLGGKWEAEANVSSSENILAKQRWQ